MPKKTKVKGKEKSSKEKAEKVKKPEKKQVEEKQGRVAPRVSLKEICKSVKEATGAANLGQVKSIIYSFLEESRKRLEDPNCVSVNIPGVGSFLKKHQKSRNTPTTLGGDGSPYPAFDYIQLKFSVPFQRLTEEAVTRKKKALYQYHKFLEGTGEEE